MSDMTQIMRDAEADANRGATDDGGSKSAYAQPTAAQLLQAAVGGRDASLTGEQIHQELLQRAAEREHILDTVGGEQALRYSSSLAGGIGNDKELRRELTLKSREERELREERFGRRKPQDKGDRKGIAASGQDRQAFNARQDTSSGHTFQEPAGRNYNPYG